MTREKFVVQSFGKVIGKFTNGTEAKKEKRFNEILSREYQKRHSVRLIRVV